MYNYIHNAPSTPFTPNRRLFGARVAQQVDDARAGVLEVLSSLLQVGKEGGGRSHSLFGRGSWLHTFLHCFFGWMVGYALLLLARPYA